METKNEKDAPEKVQDKKESWKIIKLRKPVSHMGMQIESLDLTGLDDMTLDDMAKMCIRDRHWTSQLIARGQETNLWKTDEIMNLNYAKRDGSKLTPSLVLVDSGDQTDTVYDFCADTSDYTLPAKGASRKLETDYKYSVINKAGSKACGINLVIIDTAKYKDRIAARMRRENGAGSWMVFSGLSLIHI